MEVGGSNCVGKSEDWERIFGFSKGREIVVEG